jgi:hypothetical protein
MKSSTVSIRPRAQRGYHDSPAKPLRSSQQYRVKYRLTGWSLATREKSLTFWKLESARAFLERLHRDHDLDFATLESRPVLLGRWKEVAS